MYRLKRKAARSCNLQARIFHLPIGTSAYSHKTVWVHTVVQASRVEGSKMERLMTAFINSKLMRWPDCWTVLELLKMRLSHGEGSSQTEGFVPLRRAAALC